MHFLRELRRKKGLTQQSLAALAKTSRQRINDIENGRRLPGATLLQALALHLGAEDLIIRREDYLPARLQRKLLAADNWLVLPELNKTWLKVEEDNPSMFQHLDAAKKPSRRFRRMIRCDSAAEAVVWAMLVQFGWRTYLASPVRKGFRDLPLLDGYGLALGTLRRPCLHISMDGVEYVIWPQITVLVRGVEYRLDGLVLAATGTTRLWMALELDGSGHNAKYDEARQAAIGLPFLRYAKAEMSSGHFPALLRRDLLHRCKPLAAAA